MEHSQEQVVRKKEEFTRAVSLGLMDSLRKVESWFCCKCKRRCGFLSSYLPHCNRGCNDCREYGLNAEEVGLGILARQSFQLPKSLFRSKCTSIVAEVLTCVYQSTANSSTTTREAALGIASAVGAKFHEFDVELLVQKYEELAETVIGRRLSWESDDIARQNIQARVRAPGVWLLANLYNAMLVATSNRSEAAVGYATMDGDTAGELRQSQV